MQSLCAVTLALALALAGAGADRPPLPQFEVDADRLVETIGQLPPQRSGWSSIEHQRGLVQTERWLLARLDAMGCQPRLEPVVWQSWLQSERDDGGEAPQWHNIIVELRGRGSPAEVIIVGAHYDAHPRTPGADDNATGTAALLELARVLHDRPMRRTIRLIFFTLEEAGLVGSRQHAQRYRAVLEAGTEQAIGMLSLEMLGYFSDEPGSQRSPIPPVPGVFEPPTVGNFIGLGAVRAHRPFVRELAEAMRRAEPALPVVVADHLPTPPPDFLRSDHAPFLALGVPAVIVTDTSEFRNPHYHAPGDTIETLDLERFALVVRALAGALYELAGPMEGDDAPADPP